MESLAAEHPWKELDQGDRFLIQSRSGNSYETTFLGFAADRMGGVYVRLEGGRIARLMPGRLKLESFEPLLPDEHLFPQDEILFRAQGREVRGLLLEPPNFGLLVDEGLEEPSRVSYDEIEGASLRLLFPSQDLRRGDEFLVSSRSGRKIRGLILEVRPGSAQVELPGGDTFRLDLARVVLSSFAVLIPLRLERLELL